MPMTGPTIQFFWDNDGLRIAKAARKIAGPTILLVTNRSINQGIASVKEIDEDKNAILMLFNPISKRKAVMNRIVLDFLSAKKINPPKMIPIIATSA